jgi:transketolase
LISYRKNRITFDDLKTHALEIRKNVVRMVARNGQGYVQQGLGAADIFTLLYFSEADLNPKDPDWEERDRIFLSTAHNSALFHATLAQRGILDPESLSSYTKDGSLLEINVSERLGQIVEATCGSLGQGLSVAVGVCLTAKRKKKRYRSYVILGDGELQEGQTWEAAMFASSNKLSNLCLIVDLNELQVEGHTDKVIKMKPIDEKFQAFGWNAITVNGHDFEDLERAFYLARNQTKKPTVIIAKTIVGKGVPSLEGKMSHNMILPKKVAENALKELSRKLD